MRGDDLPAVVEFDPGLRLPPAPVAALAVEFGVGGGEPVAVDGNGDAPQPPLRRSAAPFPELTDRLDPVQDFAHAIAVRRGRVVEQHNLYSCLQVTPMLCLLVL